MFFCLGELTFDRHREILATLIILGGQSDLDSLESCKEVVLMILKQINKIEIFVELSKL